MKTTTNPGGRIAGLALMALLLARGALAMQVPVMLEAKDAVADEYGQTLSNAGGALVQILRVNGQVHPPGVDGSPHASNTVVFTTRIGQGVSRAAAMQGKFSAALTPPPAEPLVARVFNAATPEAASFYADSDPFTPSGPAVLNPKLGATTNALDTADDDGDGLHNSWEKSKGSNPLLADTDGDGMSDGDEFRAGTGLTDEGSLLQMVKVQPQDGGALRASWDAVPGKAYQLQVAEGLAGAADGLFQDVNAAITADVDEVSTIITNGAALPSGFFRVRLVE